MIDVPERRTTSAPSEASWLSHYLGRWIDPQRMNESLSRAELSDLKNGSLLQAASGRREAVAELTAERLADYLTLSLQVARFKKDGAMSDALSGIAAARAKLFGSNTSGAPTAAHEMQLREFNPFNEQQWAALSDSSGANLSSLQEAWKKALEHDAGDPKFDSIKTLFTRCGEEIVKALSEKFNANGNGKINPETLQHTVFDTITNVTTAHPNGKLHDEAEPLVRSLLVGLFRADSGLLKTIARWNGSAEKLPYSAYFDARNFHLPPAGGKAATDVSGYQLLADLWKKHKKPKKMTPRDERDRQRQWAQDMYDACPSYMEQFHKQFTSAATQPKDKDFAELTRLRQKLWGLNAGFVSLAELNQMQPPHMRSWVIGDADGKTATQPETIHQGILESRVHMLQMHGSALDEIAHILETNRKRIALPGSDRISGHFGAAIQDIEDLREDISREIDASRRDRIGSVLTADKLAERIKDIKLKHEANQVVFDRLQDGLGMPMHSYSKLDVLYVNVRRCGDFFPQVEIRQNAQQQSTAMKYIGEMLKKHQLLGAGDDIVEHPQLLLDKMKQGRFRTEVQKVVAEEYERLTRKLNPQGLSQEQLFQATDGGRPLLSRLRDENLSKDEMYARQIIGIFRLERQYPSALSSYVIAEAAQASNEFKFREENRAHPELMVEAGLDKIDSLGKEVVRLGNRDYKHLMALEQMTAGTLLKTREAQLSRKMKFIPLFEDPQTILNQIKVWQNLMQDETTRGRLIEEARPVAIYDKDRQCMRQMTVADAKTAHRQAVAPADRNTFIYEGPEWMDAGSDASGRGTTIMNVIIALARELSDGILFEHPVAINGQQAVILPKNHAGIGAGNPRSQDKGNTVSSRIITQTNQGLMNLLSLVNPALSALDKQLVIEQFRYGTYQPDPQSAEKAKLPDYKGNGSSTLSKEDAVDLIARCCAVMESRVGMVYNEPYTQHLTRNTHGLLANSMNHSAREATRTADLGQKKIYPEDTPYDKLRFIGAVNRNYLSGECGPETQVLNYFEKSPTDLQVKDGVSMLAPDTYRKLIHYHKHADYATNMLSGLAVVSTYADFDNAWKMAGLERIRQSDGSYVVRTGSGATIGVEALSEKLKAYTAAEARGAYAVTASDGTTYASVDVLRTALANATGNQQTAELTGLIREHNRLAAEKLGLPEGVHLGHLALADHDRQAEGVARHVYELYFRMQKGNTQGDLDAPQEKQLAETLKDFRPEKMYDIMPEHMAAACRRHRQRISPSRQAITEDHLARMKGAAPAFDINEGGYYNAISHDLLLECGPTPIRKNELSVVIPAHTARLATHVGRQ